MTVGDLIAVDYQIELNGLLLGSGTPYDLAEAPDGTGVPDLKIEDEQRPLTHGVTFGRDLMGVRKRSWKVWVFGTTPEDAMAKVDALVAAWSPTEAVQQIVWRLPGTTRLEYGRPRKCDIDLKWLPQATAAASLQWVSSDPRQYGLDEHSQSTGPRFAAGGRTYPRTYAMDYPGATSSGITVCANGGNWPSPARIRVEGPTAAPVTVLNETTGRSMELPFALAAGEAVTIDTGTRTIVRDTGVAVLLTVADWWDLAPGVNQMTFIAGGASTGAMTVRWHDAWL